MYVSSTYQLAATRRRRRFLARLLKSGTSVIGALEISGKPGLDDGRCSVRVRQFAHATGPRRRAFTPEVCPKTRKEGAMTRHNRLQAIYLQAIYSLVGVIVLLSTLCLAGALLDPADALTKLKVDLSDTHPCQQHVSTEGVCLD